LAQPAPANAGEPLPRRLDIIFDLKAVFSLFPWLPTAANFSSLHNAIN
jgi:hypothetical protein